MSLSSCEAHILIIVAAAITSGGVSFVGAMRRTVGGRAKPVESGGFSSCFGERSWRSVGVVPGPFSRWGGWRRIPWRRGGSPVSVVVVVVVVAVTELVVVMLVVVRIARSFSVLLTLPAPASSLSVFTAPSLRHRCLVVRDCCARCGVCMCLRELCEDRRAATVRVVLCHRVQKSHFHQDSHHSRHEMDV